MKLKPTITRMRLFLLLLLGAAWQSSIATTGDGTLTITGCPPNCTTFTPQPFDISTRLAAIAIFGDRSVEMEFARTLYLDRAIYDSHQMQFIALSSDSEIHFGPLPSDFEVPLYTDFSLHGAVGGGDIISISSDAALLWAVNFDGNIQIHAAGDIFVTDTTQFREAIFPTPIPASWILLVSTLVLVHREGFRTPKSNKAINADPLQRAFQLRLRIFTSAKRAVMGGLSRR